MHTPKFARLTLHTAMAFATLVACKPSLNEAPEKRHRNRKADYGLLPGLGSLLGKAGLALSGDASPNDDNDKFESALPADAGPGGHGTVKDGGTILVDGKSEFNLAEGTPVAIVAKREVAGEMFFIVTAEVSAAALKKKGFTADKGASHFVEGNVRAADIDLVTPSKISEFALDDGETHYDYTAPPAGPKRNDYTCRNLGMISGSGENQIVDADEFANKLPRGLGNLRGCNSGNPPDFCMIPGETWRRGGRAMNGELGFIATLAKPAGNLALKVDVFTTGRVGSSRADTDSNTELHRDIPAGDLYQDGAKVVVPLAQVIQPIPNGWAGRNLRIELYVYDASDDSYGAPCALAMQMVSPIVLDLAGTLGPARVTTGVLDAHARFDLDADGQREATGWIAPGAGLLAMDRNGNGRIDDGRELFGEATRDARGVQAENGYEALARLDADGDGIVGPRDPQYHALLVWTDDDGDGASSPAELHTLPALGITAVGTASVPVAPAAESPPFANIAGLESRFFGPPRCGSAGCASYDVYFATFSATTAR